MRSNHPLLFLAVLAAIVLGATPSQAVILYGGGTNGEVFTIDQVNASGTVLGDASNNRISGLAFRSDRRLFASIVNGSNPSTLVEIDPVTGQQIALIGTIAVIGSPNGPGSTPIKIADLSFQPGTDVLYGISSGNAPNFQGGTLFSIDVETAIATEIDHVSCMFDDSAAIAFGPDGTLYLVSRNFNDAPQGGDYFIATIDPTNAQCLSAVSTNDFYDGLAVRPTDGVLFATGGDESTIVTLDPTTGAATPVGNAVRSPGDMDFVVVEQQLVNISSRARVGTGDNVAIAGFITRSDSGVPCRPGQAIPCGTNVTKRLLLRGIGPSLTVQGAPLTDRLLDPVLELYDENGALLAMNDNWKDTQQAAIQATGIPPTRDAESAILTTVAADARFTTILRGKNNTTGVGLVEVYDLDNVISAPARLLNISTRALVGTENEVLIGGTILGGSDPANFVIRGLGPSLTAAGIAGALQDPTLEFYDRNANLLDSNDDWQDSPDMGAAVMDSGLAPSDPREAALFVTPDVAGPYTSVVRGKNGTTGVGMVEVYRLATQHMNAN